MHRIPSTGRAAAVVILVGILLAACRVPEVPATISPETSGYPGPRPQSPTAGPTAIQPTRPPTVPPPAASPSPAPIQTVSVGDVAFTVTILHTGEVAGEVVPCG